MDFESIISEATKLALKRFEADDAINSVTLSDSYDFDHPGKQGPVSNRTLKRYYEKQWLPQRIAEAIDSLEDQLAVGGGILTVWRSVVIDGDPLTGFRDHVAANGVGLHWSSDRDQAHAHEGARLPSSEYLIEGRIGTDGVDWVATLASYGHPDWVGEEEVALSPVAEVEIVSLVQRKGWLTRTTDSDVGQPIDLGAMAGLVVFAGQASALASFDDTSASLTR